MNNGYSHGSSMISNRSQYHYQIEDVPWNTIAEIGHNKDKLEEMGVLDALVKGYKTPMLIPVLFNDWEDVSQIDARLQLRINDDGELILKVHRLVRK